MNWDPSMATTSCSACGRTVEAWVITCDDCVEMAETLQEAFNLFISRFNELIEDGNNIANDLKSIGIEIDAIQMEDYLLRRMQSFSEGNEIFAFNSIQKQLKEIIGEEE